jgi:hypothetical protein
LKKDRNNGNWIKRVIGVSSTPQGQNLPQQQRAPQSRNNNLAPATATTPVHKQPLPIDKFLL